MANTVSKNAKGYGYKYTDLAGVHEYLESIGATYYQYIVTEYEDDFIVTVPIIDGKEQPPRRGCRIVQATLKGVDNPAQEQGSAITYARRYSLLMAFGLATEDDDAAALSRPKKKEEPKPTAKANPNLATEAEKSKLMEKAKEVGWGVPKIIEIAGMNPGEVMTKSQLMKVVEAINKEKTNE